MAVEISPVPPIRRTRIGPTFYHAGAAHEAYATLLAAAGARIRCGTRRAVAVQRDGRGGGRPVARAGGPDVARARGLDRDALAPVGHAAVVVLGRRDVGGARDRRRRVVAGVLREAEANAGEPAVRVAAEQHAVGQHAERALQGVARDVRTHRGAQRVGRRVAGDRSDRGELGIEVLGGRQPRAAAVLGPLVGRERAGPGHVAGREPGELVGDRRAGRAARVLGALAVPVGAAVLRPGARLAAGLLVGEVGPQPVQREVRGGERARELRALRAVALGAAPVRLPRHGQHVEAELAGRRWRGRGRGQGRGRRGRDRRRRGPRLTRRDREERTEDPGEQQRRGAHRGRVYRRRPPADASRSACASGRVHRRRAAAACCSLQ